MVAYPGVVVLDIFGPLEVFGFANRWLTLTGRTTGAAYRLEILATERGPICTSSGLEIVANRALREVTEGAEGIDTLCVPGGMEGMEIACADPSLREWLRGAAPRARRIASVCTGAFVLAGAGLLSGCQVTTHWRYCRRLAEEFPEIAVLPDRIFVRDGRVISSAGVTAGIDLALAFLEEDWGQEIAALVARSMVVFCRRPGGQSQISVHLSAEPKGRLDLRELQFWIISHLEMDLNVPVLAARMGACPRHFSRTFLSEMGLTPAAYVEKARIEAACKLLEETDLPIKTIASRSGFVNAERIRRAFQRALCVSPEAYRQGFHRVAGLERTRSAPGESDLTLPIYKGRPLSPQ